MTTQYALYIRRDFCLPMLELWHHVEADLPIPFLNQKVTQRPYIIFERGDNTASSYYNVAGMSWVKTSLVSYFTKNPQDIETLADKLAEGLGRIQPIFQSPKPLSRERLLTFLSDFTEACPYAVILWLLCAMSPKERGDLSISLLEDVRNRTDKLSSGTDTCLRLSLAQLYPKLEPFTHVIATAELRSDHVPSQSTLRNRDNGFVWIENTIFSGRSAAEKAWNIKLPAQTKGEGTNIVGTTAMGGIVRGRVRRIMGHRQLSAMQDKEIIVSPMTMPDFLPAMKKAAAIVTDEGGITCHAAIVSRELGIPCVIGTGNATQILKDGDVVEVDATEGMVRILKK